MRIVGTVTLQNRSAYEQGFRAKSNIMRPRKSVLQIRDKTDGRKVLVLSTRQEVGAHEFDIKAIQNLRTKMVKEGLATIEIGTPSWNIMIRQCDPQELETFMDTIKEIKLSRKKPNGNKPSTTKSSPANDRVVMKSKENEGAEADASSVGTGESVVALIESRSPLKPTSSGSIKRARSPGLAPREAVKVRNCLTTNAKVVVIKSRDKYPSEFSSKTETIRILEIGLRKVDKRWLMLKSLTSLDIRDNILKNIETLMKMECRLRTLILVNDQIDQLPENFFSCQALRDLRHLQITGNLLKKLPSSFEDLLELNCAELSGNQLKRLPHNWIRMNKLRTLNVSKNQLSFIPEDIKNLYLTTLNMCSNPDLCKPPVPGNYEQFDCVGYDVPSLFELASVKVMNMFKKERIRCPPGLPDIITQYIYAGKYCKYCRVLTLRYTVHTTYEFSRSLAEGPMSSCLISPADCVYVKAVYCYNCDTKKVW